MGGVVLVACGFVTVHPLAADSAPARPSTGEQRVETWWEDLEKPEPQASRALLHLVAKPDETIPFLKQHLPPLKLDADELNALLSDLGSDDEARWKPAFEKLRYLDPRLAVDLPTLMKNTTESVTRNRLVEVLCDSPADTQAGKTVTLRESGDGDYNFVSNHSSWWAEHKVSRLNIGGTAKAKWTRAARAIALLEHFATPDAIAILKDLATGHPDAQPTKLAQEALANLSEAGKS
jgi:hypothetical protein